MIFIKCNRLVAYLRGFFLPKNKDLSPFLSDIRFSNVTYNKLSCVMYKIHLLVINQKITICADFTGIDTI